MRAEWVNPRERKQLTSILLVWVLVATSIVVILPLTTPKVVRGEYVHDLGGAAQEDGGPNDADGTVNNVVVWANDQDHIVRNYTYEVQNGYTLIIEAAQTANLFGTIIYIQPSAGQIVVKSNAKLITNDNGYAAPLSKTRFEGLGLGGFNRIVFEGNSEGRLVDCRFSNCSNGVVFDGAKLMAPGISDCIFLDNGFFGVRMNNALNYTRIQNTVFLDIDGSGVSLDVRNGSLNLTPQVSFYGHSPFGPCAFVDNADVSFQQSVFNAEGQIGNCLVVQGSSNNTVLDDCDFLNGLPGEYYARSNGAKFLINNCAFQQPGGELTLEAHDLAVGLPANVTLRNPKNNAGDWDNTTINATRDSSITLQWWIDVEVRDQDNHNIPNAPVYVEDRLGNPGSPPSRFTDSSGWARRFLITELIQYESTIDIFNPHNISATNGSLWGYADMENSVISKSRNVLVIVPSPPPIPPQPSPPIGLSAELTGSAWNVTLSWDASLDDGTGENDIAGYTVYKSSTGIDGDYEFASWIPANGSHSYSWTDSGAGDGNWNNYFYIVRANDTSDIEEQNIDRVGKFVKYLFVDWNLFSVPLIQTNTSRANVLRTLESNYSRLQGYHSGKSTPWLHWSLGKPYYFNHVTDIDHINGFYIKMKNADYLVVAGRVPSFTQIQLKAGWNMVGFPSLSNRTLDDALSSIAGNYNIVMYYDTKLKKEIRLEPDDYMEPGLGYWIHATADCVLKINN